MNDLFLKRMSGKGTTVGEAMKKNSDLIMNSSFTHDPHVKKVRVYFPHKDIDVFTEAKYQKINKYSILKDQVDYRLQFRPREHYPIGSYVDIPNDADEIETWFLVGKDDNPQFVKYAILKCNWTLKWVVSHVVYSALGVLRNRNNYNSGIWNDGFITSVENQISFWVPTNPITQTIYYDKRFLISDNSNAPLSYFVTKLEDTFPQGITKVILKQDMFNPSRDNKELMIADYYNSSLTAEKEIVVASDDYATIDISAWKNANVVIGSSGNELVGHLYKNKKEIFIPGVWTHNIPSDLQDKFIIRIDPATNILSISCVKDYTLVGTVITFVFGSAEHTIFASQKVEVVAR